EGTDIKPGVSDVPSYKFDSDNESWGDSEDESNYINDDDNANDDDSENEDDDGNDAHDSERTDLDDDDKNPSFTLKDYDEEEHDEEYESNDAYENMYEEEDVDLYKDVEARSSEETEATMRLNGCMTLRKYLLPIVTIKAKIDVVDEIRKALTPYQWSIFEKTCFRHWLDVRLKNNSQLLIHTLLTRMVDGKANELSFLIL
nr:hypothetical protein [Tanacetum cinerariifolium]